MAKRWSRKTQGENMQVFVSKPVNYTTQATYSAFLANAAVGEIGLFDDTTPNPVLIPVSALAAGAKFFIAQKQTVGTKKSPVYINGTEATCRKILYTAPVNQVGSIGWNGVGGGLNNGTILPAISNYEIGVLDITEANDPYPNWNYNYTPKTGDTVVECLQAIAKQANDTTSNLNKTQFPIITAGVRTNGTVTSFTLTGTTPTITFTLGSNVGVLGGTTPAFNGAVGDYIITPLGGAAVVPGNTNSNTYKITATSAGVSITLDRTWSEPTIAMTQAQVQGAASGLNKVATVTAAGLILTAINNNEVFRMMVRGDLINADMTQVSSYTRGSGTYQSVFDLEQEGTTFQGNTAKNTLFGDAAFGNPDQFALSTDTYDYFYFDVFRRATLTNNIAEGTKRSQILLAAARSAGNLKAQLQTIFGV